MSENSDKSTEATDNAAETDEDNQAADAKVEETSEDAQAASAKTDEQPESPPEESAEDKDKSPHANEKPLEKMTVKELRELAKDIPGITGVHAMKKDELIAEIKAAKGIKDEPAIKADADTRELKLKIKALKAERKAALEAKDKKKATIFRRRISRLKKKTRRASA